MHPTNEVPDRVSGGHSGEGTRDVSYCVDFFENVWYNES